MTSLGVSSGFATRIDPNGQKHCYLDVNSSVKLSTDASNVGGSTGILIGGLAGIPTLGLAAPGAIAILGYGGYRIGSTFDEATNRDLETSRSQRALAAADDALRLLRLDEQQSGKRCDTFEVRSTVVRK